MRISPIFCALVAVVVSIFTQPSIEAQSLLSNTQFRDLSQSSSSRIPFGEDINMVNAWMAQGFKTGSEPQGYFLNAVVLPFDAAIGQPAGMLLQLFTSTPSGLPGSRIATFSGSSTPVAQRDYQYVARGPLIVSPNTSYYFVLTAARVPGFQNDQFLWYRSTQASGVSSDGWAVGDLAYSINGGPWTGFGIPGTFEIDGIAVPEPSFTALFALGVVAQLGYHFRYRRQRFGLVRHL